MLLKFIGASWYTFSAPSKNASTFVDLVWSTFNAVLAATPDVRVKSVSGKPNPVVLIWIVLLSTTFETVNSLPFRLLLPSALSAVAKLPAILILLFAVIPVVLASVKVKVFSAALKTALCPLPLSPAAIWLS